MKNQSNASTGEFLKLEVILHNELWYKFIAKKGIYEVSEVKEKLLNWMEAIL